MPTACPNCGRGINRTDRFCDGCGTYLDWATMGPGDSQVLRTQATEAAQGTRAAQLPRPEDQRAAVQLQLASDMIQVAPGSVEATAFTVRNLGTQVEDFRCAVSGPEWITADPAAISVYPGQEATGAVQAAPPRSPGSLAGVTGFRLTVTSAVHANVSGSAAGGVEVAPYFELAAELVPSSSSGRGLTRHSVTLDNRGNTPLRVALRATDVADGLRVGVPAYADVRPGTVAQVPVGVQAARQFLGRPLPKAFSVIAEPPKPLGAARLPGTRTVLPVFPTWVPVAAGLIVAAGAIAGLAAPKLIAGTRPPASPTSTSVTLLTTPNSGPSTQATSAPSSSAASATSATSASSSASSSTSTTQVTGSSSSTTPATPAGQLLNLITAAPSAMWTSESTLGDLAVSVKQNLTGCQAAPGPGVGAVYSLSQVTLEGGLQASTALETEPPARESGVIYGVYTLSAPTTAGAVFTAEVGFCDQPAFGTEMYYTVVPGSLPPAGEQYSALSVGPGQLVSCRFTLPAGTTQVTLSVWTGPPQATTYGGVYWVNPVIEEPAAPAPSPT